MQLLLYQILFLRRLYVYQDSLLWLIEWMNVPMEHLGVGRHFFNTRYLMVEVNVAMEHLGVGWHFSL